MAKISDLKLTTLEEELILSELLDKPREFLLSNPDLKLTAKQVRDFNQRQKQLKKGLPLAYVLGFKWFYNHKLKVTKDTLIPRPETEQLVDLAARHYKKLKPDGVIDIGTGTGAIIISLRDLFPKKTKAHWYASDISKEALSIARKNSKLTTKCDISFKHGDLLKPHLSSLKKHKSLLILSNLPYLFPAQMKEPSIKHEPKGALLGGPKGYELIFKLLQEISKLQPKKAVILLEINFDQGEVIKKEAKRLFPKAKVKIYKDLNKHDRIVEIVY
jgi:release factor glutamine methyltransferase